MTNNEIERKKKTSPETAHGSTEWGQFRPKERCSVFETNLTWRVVFSCGKTMSAKHIRLEVKLRTQQLADRSTCRSLRKATWGERERERVGRGEGGRARDGKTISAPGGRQLRGRARRDYHWWSPPQFETSSDRRARWLHATKCSG